MTGKHLIKLGIDECIDSIEFNLNGCTLSDTECNDWDYNYDAGNLPTRTNPRNEEVKALITLAI